MADPPPLLFSFRFTDILMETALVAYHSDHQSYRGSELDQWFLIGWIINPWVTEFCSSVNERKGVNEGWMKIIFLIFCVLDSSDNMHLSWFFHPKQKHISNHE